MNSRELSQQFKTMNLKLGYFAQWWNTNKAGISGNSRSQIFPNTLSEIISQVQSSFCKRDIRIALMNNFLTNSLFQPWDSFKENKVRTVHQEGKDNTALVFQPMHNYALVNIANFATRFEGILEKYEKSQFKKEILIKCL